MTLSMIGRYYTNYRRMSSYPEGLGQELVDDIPKEPKGYNGEIQLKT
jgi:hypothetical protein